ESASILYWTSVALSLHSVVSTGAMRASRGRSPGDASDARCWIVVDVGWPRTMRPASGSVPVLMAHRSTPQAAPVCTSSASPAGAGGSLDPGVVDGAAIRGANVGSDFACGRAAVQPAATNAIATQDV